MTRFIITNTDTGELRDLGVLGQLFWWIVG